MLTVDSSYVINAEAAKKFYKHTAKAQEPRDLGREWHSDRMSLALEEQNDS